MLMAWTSRGCTVTRIPWSPLLAIQSRGQIGTLLPLRLRRLCKNEEASKRCRVTAAFSHGSVLMAAETGCVAFVLSLVTDDG